MLQCVGKICIFSIAAGHPTAKAENAPDAADFPTGPLQLLCKCNLVFCVCLFRYKLASHRMSGGMPVPQATTLQRFRVNLGKIWKAQLRESDSSSLWRCLLPVH